MQYRAMTSRGGFEFQIVIIPNCGDGQAAVIDVFNANNTIRKMWQRVLTAIFLESSLQRNN